MKALTLALTVTIALVLTGCPDDKKDAKGGSTSPTAAGSTNTAAAGSGSAAPAASAKAGSGGGW